MKICKPFKFEGDAKVLIAHHTPGGYARRNCVKAGIAARVALDLVLYASVRPTDSCPDTKLVLPGPGSFNVL
jgi:hypothetical protein